ncbi:cupin domain-containing protein [Rhodovarius crocodyli]|uniref:Cupin domain-containing protein n=2 Tax=Rhodovarius crocodyli TaxID=1979269 RepID=A0A437M3M5_9PROT|nr:cupin domain-containing protein [Rhodovarius crocodyli]
MDEQRVMEKTAGVLSTIGQNIRALRTEKGLTLQSLAERTGLSPSMLSLLERGKTGPSIGTLVVIASALGAQMSELLDRSSLPEEDIVSRADGQQVIETEPGVRRRILKQDRLRGVEVALNEYEPGTSNAPTPAGHEGYEYGVVLDGSLEVVVNDRTHVLNPGDLISYPSPHPHRFTNTGKKRVRTLWINLRKA